MAYDAVVILPLNEPVFICWELDTNVGLFAILLNSTYDAVAEAASINPVNMPLNDPVNDPVFICCELLTVPTGNPDGMIYDEVTANDAVVIDPLNDPVLICCELETSVGLNPTLLKSTYDAVAIVVGLFCI